MPYYPLRRPRGNGFRRYGGASNLVKNGLRRYAKSYVRKFRRNFGPTNLASITYHKFRRMGETFRLAVDQAVGGAGLINLLTSGPLVGNQLALGAPGFNNGSTVTDNGAQVQFGGAVKFMLANVINNNELTVLYDQYKIDYVELIMTINAPFVSQADPGVSAPLMYITPDYDDFVAPAVPETIQQYSKCRTFVMDGKRIFKMRIKPRTAAPVYQQGVVNAYSQGTKGFIDCAYPSVEYYGIKFYFVNFPTHLKDACTVTFNTVYHITMKNSR